MSSAPDPPDPAQDASGSTPEPVDPDSPDGAPTSAPPRPKRALGQNFLVDRNIQRRIIEVADFTPGDEVLEIGPGQGALTRHLAGAVERLILVELDNALARRLIDEYRGRPEVEVIHGNVLDLDLAAVSRDVSSLRVIGNIPYNITAPILFKFLERPRARDILLMVQREVADRIVADAGTGAYGALAVGVRSVARVEQLLPVPRTAFRPVPKVDSSIIRVTPLDPPPLSQDEEERLRTLTRAAFQWRRKQFQKTLRDHPDLALSREAVERLQAEAGMDLTRRPETFSPESFIRLSTIMAGLEV
ncbi:MAG: 16S rRNA (adenine(1518)-N(6)/adenine(1519)-N(6))-dimethyltransferase RsmA [Gemmatimonadota bacterium]